MEFIKLLEILKTGESGNVEFKRNDNADLRKDICAFANSRDGGVILLGVDDDGNPVGVDNMSEYKQKISNGLNAIKPSPRLEFDEIEFDNKKIVIIKVLASNTLASYANIVYIRAGVNNYQLSIDEVIERSAESLRIHFDKQPSTISKDKIDIKLFEAYLKKRKETRGGISYDDHDMDMQSLNIVKGEKLTNAGVMCFTNNPQDTISGTTVRLVEFTDDEMQQYKERKEFTGPLNEVVVAIEQYFLKNLSRVGGFHIGFKSQEFLEYPIKGLREALINAVLHRNYFDPAETQIFIYPNRIEINNPGSFPPGVTLENPEHKPRNPIVAQIFYDLGLTEKYGSGLRKIFKSAEEHPFVDVKFEIKPYRTKVIFTKSMGNEVLDKTNQKILEFLASGEKSSSEISDYIGLSRQATVKRINDLTTLGLVYKSGLSSNTKYGNMSKKLERN